MTVQPTLHRRPSYRLAQESDTVALGILILEGLLQSPSTETEASEMPSDPQILGEDLILGTMEKENALLMVADIEDQLAAVIRLTPRDLVHARHVGDVQLLVHPNARAQGIGAGLLHALAMKATAQGTVKLAMRIADDDRGLQRTVSRCGWQRERREHLALRREEHLRSIEVWALHLGHDAPHAS
jgi:GNAT superfamily N-acetyltransferase